MTPVSKGQTGTWDTKVETLELQFPYELFKKIVLSQSAHIQVGKSAIELREKNLMALKDLNSRVIAVENKSVSR